MSVSLIRTGPTSPEEYQRKLLQRPHPVFARPGNCDGCNRAFQVLRTVETMERLSYVTCIVELQHIAMESLVIASRNSLLEWSTLITQ